MQIEKTTGITNAIARPPETPPPAATTETWRTLAEPWWRATLAVLPAYIITRLILVLLTYFGGVLFSVANYSPEVLTFRDVLYKWYHWDAIRFISIATKGYTSLEYAAFFPLYPALERVVSKVLHSDILLTGMLISNLALLGTLVVLYRLTETEFDRETAKRTVLYLSIFPTAFFFFAAYNESLFLFFMLLSFYSLRRGFWWLAGLFGGLATLTRSIGLLLMVVFMWEYLRQRYPQLRQAWQERKWRHMAGLLSGLPALLIIPLGLGVYAAGLYKIFGDPLAFAHAQVNWREHLNFPWVAPLRALQILFSNSPFTFASPHILIDLGALVLFLILLALCIFGPERFASHQWAFVLFGLMALTYSLLFPGLPLPGGVPYDPLPSTQRFVLEVFPAFILLARLGRRQWFHQGYLLFTLPMMAFLTLRFLTGGWMV